MGTPCPAEFLLKHPPEICTRKPENHGIWLRQWQCSRSCPWPRWIPMSRIGQIKKSREIGCPQCQQLLSLFDWRFQSRSSSLQGVRSAVSALGRGNTPASAESQVGMQCLVEALWQMIVVLRMKLQRSLEVSWHELNLHSFHVLACFRP